MAEFEHSLNLDWIAERKETVCGVGHGGCRCHGGLACCGGFVGGSCIIRSGSLTRSFGLTASRNIGHSHRIGGGGIGREHLVEPSVIEVIEADFCQHFQLVIVLLKHKNLHRVLNNRRIDVQFQPLPLNTELVNQNAVAGNLHFAAKVAERCERVIHIGIYIVEFHTDISIIDNQVEHLRVNRVKVNCAVRFHVDAHAARD